MGAICVTRLNMDYLIHLFLQTIPHRKNDVVRIIHLGKQLKNQ